MKNFSAFLILAAAAIFGCGSLAAASSSSGSGSGSSSRSGSSLEQFDSNASYNEVSSSGLDSFSEVNPLKACNHTYKRVSQNDLLPVARVTFTPDILSESVSDMIGMDVGVSFMGEAGVRNYRGNGTVGIYITPSQRIKAGGEWLTQKLKYHYLSGIEHHWVHQWAVGGQYQYLFDSCFLYSLDVSGDYSHAPSKTLKTVSCPPITVGANTVYNTIQRRIAGSKAYNVEAGMTVIPWGNATLSLAADYDNVKYDRKFHRKEISSGWGGTVKVSQRLPHDLIANFIAQVKKPYNFYEGSIKWVTTTNYGNIDVGIFGGFTQGKRHLPCSTIAGVSVGLDFGGFGCGTPCTPCGGSASSEIAQWVAMPAVYVPQVLAIAEQLETTVLAPVCLPPLVLVPVSSVEITSLPAIIPTSTLFSTQGQFVTYSIITPPGITAVIDPVTGIIEVISLTPGVTYPITVTATTGMGGCSASAVVNVSTGTS